MSANPKNPTVDRLLEIMARLRDPDHGCPWDCEQSFRTIAPYTIEEAYEVAEAIARNDLQELREELGDLLFQVVFHARLAEEDGAFDFADVVGGLCEKMIARHPHVFGEGPREGDVARQSAAWESHKAAERAHKAAQSGNNHSVLDGVALALPALARAEKLQRRAARVGFDWPHRGEVVEKIREELEELTGEINAAGVEARLSDELGDLLFATVNLARHLGIDAEAALRAANGKFERRFRAVESKLHAAGTPPKDSSLAEMESLWQGVKAAERLNSNATAPSPRGEPGKE